MISAARAELAIGQARLAGLERRESELETRAAKLGAERAALHQERAEMISQVGELERSLDRHRDSAHQAKAEKARLDGNMAELKERIRQQERDLDEGKVALAHARSRCAALHEMRERLEGVGAGTKALVGMRDECVLGIVADRIEAPAKFTQALAGLLGARLQDVVVQDMCRGIEMLEHLASTRKGRAAVVPHRSAFTAGKESGSIPDEGEAVRLVDQLLFAPEDESLVRSIVGDAWVVSDMPAALRLREAGARSKVVTLAGTVLCADGRVEGGQGDELSAGMLEGKREARELAGEILRLEEAVQGVVEALDASRMEAAQVGRALDLARQETHAQDIAVLTLEKDLQKNAGLLESMARRLGELEGQEGELALALDETRGERGGALSAISDAGERIAAAEAELQQGEAVLEHTRSRRDARREAVLAIKVAVASMAEKLAAARAADARLGRSVSELEDRRSRLGEDLQSGTVAYEETTAQLAVHEAALAASIERARVAQGELEAVRAGAESLRADLAARERELRDRRSQLEGIRDELQTHEISLREKQMALQHLLSGVADRFRGLQLPSVVADYHMRPCPDGVSRARVEELLRLIERMGSINLDAVRELKEAEERFVFYTTQKDDLDKALSDLQRAILQMNRESRRLFEETFSAVNARFQEIFPRMFRGGRAELRMTNPDDLLETGIDIVAQPPGKKLSNIELMSGGEKALTAVSLIFAIFQIKPSPFCILDEVDAPLDDANVARYNETVRSMTDQSQFILITHHKRTMQMVDVLYGVTMPEAGVSKIVSVRISEGVRKVAPVERDAAVA
jgi:chromosome segregation protein